MNVATVSALLSGKVAVDEQVTIQGWVRSRRDSKAGMSFVHVSDGSCFDAIQAVCDNSLTNYEEQIIHLTAGCSVEISGTLAASQGKGQSGAPEKSQAAEDQEELGRT